MGIKVLKIFGKNKPTKDNYIFPRSMLKCSLTTVILESYTGLYGEIRDQMTQELIANLATLAEKKESVH